MFSKLKAYLTPNFSNHPMNWLLAPLLAFSIGYFPLSAFSMSVGDTYFKCSAGMGNCSPVNFGLDASQMCDTWYSANYASNSSLHKVFEPYQSGYRCIGKFNINNNDAVDIRIFPYQCEAADLDNAAHICHTPSCEIPQGDHQIFHGYAPSYESCMSTSGIFGYQNCGMTIGSVSGSPDPVTCSNGPGTCFNEGLYSCSFTAYSTGEYSDADNHSWPDSDTGTDPDDDANDGEGDDTDPEGEGEGTGETDTGGDNDQTGDGDNETGDGSDDTGGTGDDGDTGTDPDNDDGTGDSSGDGTGDSSGDPDDGTPDGNSNTGGASAGNGDGTGEGEEDGICSEPGMSEKLLCQEIVPPEVGEPGAFDLDALDDELEQAWSDLSDVISSTKADIKSTLSLSLSSGSGGLPCLGSFVFNGVTKEICLAPYAEEISKLSSAILFLCIIIGILIILR